VYAEPVAAVWSTARSMNSVMVSADWRVCASVTVIACSINVTWVSAMVSHPTEVRTCSTTIS
jgi:hypothetical protein